MACLVLILLIISAAAPAAYANSAEPPSLTVIVALPPDDLTLSLRLADGSITDAIQLQKEQKAWEAYYRFFNSMLPSQRSSLEGATLIVHSSEKSFECLLSSSVSNQYNNLITLDIANETVIEGEAPARTLLLVAMRVALTLLVEGLVFFVFGYRKRASWITFLVVNLVTQGVLNYILSGVNLGYIWIIGLVLFEIIIFAVEALAFTLILKEHKKGRAVWYALAANFASLILGGLLISYLPV